MVTVLKLGGSVITEKDTPETVDDEALSRALDLVADARAHGVGDLALVHGGGSFGHHHADQHGVSATEGTRDAAAVTAIHGAMGRLNSQVVAGLQERGVEAVPVRPLSVGVRDEGLTFPLDQVAGMLAEGFVPVLHGDVVTTAGAGATILSGDEIVVRLSSGLDAGRTGLCTGVPGVLGRAGAVVEEIDDYESVETVLGDSDATDVTGGMAEKVRQLLRLDAPACVFDLDGLEQFLSTGTAGTVVRG